MITCRVCSETKPEEKFEIIKHSGNRRKACRICIANQKREKRNNNPEWKSARAFTLLKWKYGITREQYEIMLAEQSGGCAVCGEVVDYLLHVDHEHDCCVSAVTCGSCVRGLLCRPCNAGMGMMKDSPVRLRKAAEYLERRRA